MRLDRLLNPALDAVWGPVMEAEYRARLKRGEDGRIEEKTPPAVFAALNQKMAAYRPDDSGIQAPLMSIYALQDGADYLSAAAMTAGQQALVCAAARSFLLEQAGKESDPWQN